MILENALNTASGLLKDKKVAVVGSCRSTLEELFYWRLSTLLKAKNFLRGHFGEDDGILQSADRTPNLRGALVSGFEKEYPSDNLKKLNLALKKKQFEAVLVVGEDLIASGIDAENLMGVDLIHLATHSNQTSCLAKVVIPLLSHFEKTGTYINRGFYAQSFEQAVPGPAGLIPDTQILTKLISLIDPDCSISSNPAEIWETMSKVRNSVLKELASRMCVNLQFILMVRIGKIFLSLRRKLFTSSRLNFLPINNAISIWKHCNSSGLRYFCLYDDRCGHDYGWIFGFGRKEGQLMDAGQGSLTEQYFLLLGIFHY